MNDWQEFWSRNRGEDFDAWEVFWSRNGGLKKGEEFDASQCEPALQALLDSGVLPGGPTLVPGCGRGYAVAALAEDGSRDVLGLDISPTAVKAAQDFLAEVQGRRGRVAVDDFFGSHRESHTGYYSLGYDCTFLCAIPPEYRQQWADTWATVLKKNGQLVTLVFPLTPEGSPDPADGSVGSGPPYALSMKLLTQLLEPRGFKLISAEEVPQSQIARGSKSGEIIARWTRT